MEEWGGEDRGVSSLFEHHLMTALQVIITASILGFGGMLITSMNSLVIAVAEIRTELRSIVSQGVKQEGLLNSHTIKVNDHETRITLLESRADKETRVIYRTIK